MKLLRFGPKGHEKPGLLDQDGNVRSLQGVVDYFDGVTLSTRLNQLRETESSCLPLVEEGVRLAEPVAKVGKFLCVGLNYSDHASEAGMPIPAEPIIFAKATSAINGPNHDVYLPPRSQKKRSITSPVSAL
jgi:2-keto-4-pentenoate hydratase/2-oxohepta-3-ene-1,7-dioic acid hydratase in catechol pathway